MNTLYQTSRSTTLTAMLGAMLGAMFLINFGCTQSSKLSKNPIARGETFFNSYCTSCHGENATGNGPAAEALATRPTDLTQLRINNDGVFPTDKVYATIDGREVLYSHGTRQMPIWGNIWSEKNGKPRREEDVHKQISEIVEYLRSIQQPVGE